jgi:hypothetical protein
MIVGARRVIFPWDSAASRLYIRLIGNQLGLQMPPTGALSTDQIDIIKRWIGEGAKWPDELSGETPHTHPDPRAGRIMAALRTSCANNHRILPAVQAQTDHLLRWSTTADAVVPEYRLNVTAEIDLSRSLGG